MIIDGCSNTVDKIITVPGPPGLTVSDVPVVDGGTASSSYGGVVLDGGGSAPTLEPPGTSVTRVQQRHDTASGWAVVNPVLYQGEVGYVEDTTDFKVGDGSTPWNALATWSPNTSKGAAKLVSIGDLGYGSSLLAYAASTAGTGEHMFTVGVAATGITAQWNHWYTSTAPNVDTDPSGSISFNASLRVVSSSNPGTVINQIYRLTFNGRTTATLDPGGRITADVLGLSLAVGDIVAIRTYLSSGTGYSPHITSGFFSTTVGGFISGDLTAPGSAAISGTEGYYYGPSMLLGHAQNAGNAKSVLILGDSRAFGAGDNGITFTIPQIAPGGFFVRALSGKTGVLNLAANGDMAGYFQGTNGSFRRLSNVPRCNSAIIEDDINDLYNAHITAAALETILLNLATDVRRMGISKVFLTTSLPYTTSTDGWATTGNQTVFNSTYETQRVAKNTWVRAGCPVNPTTLAPVSVGTAGALTAGQYGHPINGFFDTAATIESSLNSGLWLPAKRIATGSITSGAAVITSSTANFQSAIQEVGGDLGTCFSLAGAGTSGAYMTGSAITLVSSTTSATASGLAGTTVTNAQLVMGVSTVDGLHPSSDGCVLIAAAINPAVL